MILTVQLNAGFDKYFLDLKPSKEEECSDSELRSKKVDLTLDTEVIFHNLYQGLMQVYLFHTIDEFLKTFHKNDKLIPRSSCTSFKIRSSSESCQPAVGIFTEARGRMWMG